MNGDAPGPGDPLHGVLRTLTDRTHQVERDIAALLADLEQARRGCPQDAADIAATRQAQAELSRAIEERRRELAQLAAAQQRAASGEFGVCQACGEPIDPKRLVAIATAAHCVACASGADS